MYTQGFSPLVIRRQRTTFCASNEEHGVMTETGTTIDESMNDRGVVQRRAVVKVEGGR